MAQFNKSSKGQSKSSYLDLFYRQQRKATSSDPFASTKKKKGSNSVDVAKVALKPIATLSIPRLKEVLPVYGNTSDDALNNGIGLMNNTGDLLGGKGKHPALAGHRGLSIGRLFTDLPKMKVKDKFFIKVHGEIHAYEVDRMKTVKPNQLSALAPDPHKDYVTLITCTPLFTNTHRLLVRGHRVKYVSAENTGETGGLTPLGLLVVVVMGTVFIVSVLWGIHRHRINHHVYTY